MKNIKKLILRPAIIALLLPVLLTATVGASEHHIKAALEPVGGSGVSGFVNLTQLAQGGTQIDVVANGLQPGGNYVSLYYDNSTCALPGDLLGSYTANPSGIGTTRGVADDDLDEVDSVSVRVSETLELLACAVVNP
jgi:hypothetical protein